MPLFSLLTGFLLAGDFPDLTNIDDFVHVPQNRKTIWHQIPLAVLQSPADGFIMINPIDSKKEKTHQMAIKKEQPKNVIKNDTITSDELSEYCQDSADIYDAVKKDRARQYALNHHYKGSYHKTKQEEDRIARILFKKHDHNNPSRDHDIKEKKEKKRMHEKNCNKTIFQQDIQRKLYIHAHNSPCIPVSSIEFPLTTSLNPASILPVMIMIHQLCHPAILPLKDSGNCIRVK